MLAPRVPIVSSIRDVAAHLEMIARTIQNDLVPLLDIKGGAPYTVTRNWCAYVDYLGALYTGTSRPDVLPGIGGLPQAGSRFRKYVEEVMENVDGSYARYAKPIYLMYRNGGIHEFDPRLLQNSYGETLVWATYPGDRHGYYWPNVGARVSHLRMVRHPSIPKLCYLPVSTRCLLEDLLTSIRYFTERATDPAIVVSHWNETATILNTPVRCEWDREDRELPQL